jgi:Nickel responsive protein SCO4226-like
LPLYMDVHNMDEEVTCDAVREAHAKDLEVQGNHGVNYKSYWVAEAEGKIFCLVEAPDAETAARVHRDAHGLVADEIYEVQEGS